MEFNAEQRQAIRSDVPNLLVLAGAGTGKTRTIIGRALHLMQQDVNPQRIAIITFTRRAANEIQHRLREASPEGGKRVVAGTFHYLCLRIMSARRNWFGYSDMTIMDRDDQLQLMRIIRGEVAGKQATIPSAAELINYYSYARNTNQSPEDYLKKFVDIDEAAIQVVLECFAGYKARKQANSYLDYDDILHRFARVLHDDEEVARKVCTQFDHLLVDEMQDTNPLQWLILESFAKHCQLFCVGDDAQSIYAFRGADFKNVHSFTDRLENAQTLKLQQNYRSTQPILDLSNWLLAASSLKYNKKLESTRGGGDKPQLLDFDSDFDEAEWIVDSLKARQAQGKPWSDHMILCRTAYSARPIEGVLIEQKIPYRFVGGIGLLQTAHVRDLLAVLRSIVNQHDELAWIRFLTLWQGIGDITAARLLEKVMTQSDVPSALEALKAALPKRAEIVKVLSATLKHIDAPVSAIATARELLEPVLKPKYDRWEVRSKDLVLLEELARNHSSVSSFLDTYTLDPISASEVTAEQESEEGVVTLITVHSAKGTEAPVCYVAAAHSGNYPHSRSVSDPDAIEEERRVLYVALTRAQDELIITRHLSRPQYGRMSWNSSYNSHYFLEELPYRLIESGNYFSSSPSNYLNDDVI